MISHVASGSAPRLEQSDALLALGIGEVLSPKTQTNLKNAKSYFGEHLAVGDYYSESEKVVGEWIGTGAGLLKLGAIVGQEEFLKLCDNRHPQTGERLTQRLNHSRRDVNGNEAEVANRRVFFDFTFSPPKSVSVAALVAADKRIVVAHAEAVKTALNPAGNLKLALLDTGDVTAPRLRLHVCHTRHESDQTFTIYATSNL